MIKVNCNDKKLESELLLIVKLFYTPNEIETNNLDIVTNIVIDNDIVCSTYLDNILVNEKVYKYTALIKNNLYKYLRRFVKINLYKALSDYSGKKFEWGSLTGIRPTKLLIDLYQELGNIYKAEQSLIDDFYVSKQKVDILTKIIKNQNRGILNDKLVNFYVNIPFCPTRCTYCSFVSGGINECRKYVRPYIDTLKKEIIKTKEFLNKNNYMIKSIYVGGGTPTTLEADELNEILSLLSPYNVKEFTVEAGRPDSITDEKLKVLHDNGVTRISINPQTFCNKTLKLIGRNHTSKDVIQAYSMALNYNFKINMDIIAGLPQENLVTFKKTVNKILDLHPDNITVHTLSIKRNSVLQKENDLKSEFDVVTKMVDYATKTIMDSDYNPYYLYKQKNMIGNQENIGYFYDNSACVFNIDSMEEIATIVACGANGISKRYFSLENRIERFANVKNFDDYINRIDYLLDKKFELLK